MEYAYRIVMTIILTLSSAQAKLSCDEKGNIFVQKKDIYKLQETMEKSVENTRFTDGQHISRVFKNSYDFHSSVLGHLSLYQISEVLEDLSLKSKLNLRMRRLRLKKILKKIKKISSINKHYAISWFVRLLDYYPEEDMTYWQNQLFEEFYNDNIQDIDLRNISGAYDSFYLLMYNFLNSSLSFNQAANKKINKIVRLYEKNELYYEGYSLKEYDFLQPIQVRNLYYSKVILNEFNETELPEEMETKSCHVFGRYISEEWFPIGEIENQSQKIEQCHRVTTKLNNLFSYKNGEIFNTNSRMSYYCTAHWIPQYMWQALWINKDSLRVL